MVLSSRVLRTVICSFSIAFCLLSRPQAQLTAQVRYLDQGWTESQRQRFYTLSQGSQLMPLAWFAALERPETDELFVSDNLSRFGFLPSSNSSTGLPVGFAKDENGGTWVGLTCAACHTSQIEKNAVTLQIDGAPTNADLLSFLVALDKSINATLQDPAKFARFAARVVGDSPHAQRDLRYQFTRFSAYFSTFVQVSTPENAWGPGRTDAFGMIFNRVSAIDLSDAPVWAWFQPLEQNNRTPNAPVSYPFLWGTSRENFVQWNAIAPNKLKYERLERNIVEVLGVFARINLAKSTTLSLGYRSTVNVTNQVELEEKLVHFLKPPQWPEDVLGQIDQIKVNKGRDLFQQRCISCHTVADRNGTGPIVVSPISVDEVGTDPAMTTSVACRTADTGMLAGSRQPPIGGHKLGTTDFVSNVAANIGIGVLENWLATGSSIHTAAKTKPTAASQAVQAIPKPFRTATAATGTCQESLKVYKAGPLNGIWATAPYLHNGSVPNLYQLLLPGSQRAKQFKVGSRKFDSLNVGFDTQEGTFEFDTALPGNSNAGHSYGTDLNDEQRWAIVEFLKTL